VEHLFLISISEDLNLDIPNTHIPERSGPAMARNTSRNIVIYDTMTNERYGTELTMRTELSQHYYYHWVDTSSGRVLGSNGIIHPVVKASTMTTGRLLSQGTRVSSTNIA
jgi:hypothetical protein